MFKKYGWLIAFIVAAILCYVCYFLTKQPMWMIFGVLFLFTGGMQSVNAKEEEKSKQGGYNQRNREKAKKYSTKKRDY